jgi:hypothetical protein
VKEQSVLVGDRKMFARHHHAHAAARDQKQERQPQEAAGRSGP